jgi:hypothetical protein
MEGLSVHPISAVFHGRIVERDKWIFFIEHYEPADCEIDSQSIGSGEGLNCPILWALVDVWLVGQKNY